MERTFRYGPYGENIKSEGTQTIPYPFGYKGGYRIPGGNAGHGNVTNGLLHYGQRYYDPTTGRWTQQDPFKMATSPTQADGFVFAAGDPTNVSDPTGEIGVRELACLGAILAACNGSIFEQQGMGDEGYQTYPSADAIYEIAYEELPVVEDIAEEAVDIFG